MPLVRLTFRQDVHSDEHRSVDLEYGPSYLLASVAMCLDCDSYSRRLSKARRERESIFCVIITGWVSIHGATRAYVTGRERPAQGMRVPFARGLALPPGI